LHSLHLGEGARLSHHLLALSLINLAFAQFLATTSQAGTKMLSLGHLDGDRDHLRVAVAQKKYLFWFRGLDTQPTTGVRFEFFLC